MKTIRDALEVAEPFGVTLQDHLVAANRQGISFSNAVLDGKRFRLDEREAVDLQNGAQTDQII